MELYKEDDRARRYSKHTMFWEGLGFKQEHSHSVFDEWMDVVFDEAVYYYIKGRRYTASAGDVISTPAGKRRRNPFNPFNAGVGY